jgi:enoyl-CoA hydratase/carnithine racemase
VSEVFANDKLRERAYELAEMVVALPPLAIRKTKELVRTAQSVTLKENLDQAALFQGVLQQLDDHREAIDAILEKRKPVFKGA